MLLPPTWIVFFGEVHVFLLLRRTGLYGKKGHFLHVEIYDMREYSVQKLPQFSQENKVLTAAGCNLDGFLSSNPCVFSIQLNWSIWN
jgi:hypothetical protein